MTTTITTHTQWAAQLIDANGGVEQTIFYISRHFAEIAVRRLNDWAVDSEPRAELAYFETPVVEDDAPNLRLVTS